MVRVIVQDEVVQQIHQHLSASKRPNLKKPVLLWLLAIVGGSFPVVTFLFHRQAPGSSAGQLAATFGTLLLLVPIAFSLLKRCGYSNNPPFWFVAHVLCSSLGTLLIFVHVAGGNWLSPPGLVLLALIFLVTQGTVSRVFFSQLISNLFARSVESFNFTSPLLINREVLSDIIAAKVTLLKKLDGDACEAQFSPTLYHWLKSPVMTLQYHIISKREINLVGAKERAGVLLSLWRRIHIFCAVIFFVGLFSHIVVVLFFAGYVVGENEVYWWHVATGWGK